MALFTEKKIENALLEQLNLKDLEKGASVLFYVGGFEDRNSVEYGDFKVVEGLLLDEKATSVDALISSAVGASFIPNTLLLNMIKDKKLRDGLVYRIEKAWDKDEKFAGGKKAKGYGFNVYEVGCDGDTLSKLLTSFLNAKAGENDKEI